MNYTDFELSFSRALSFSKAKFFLVFSTLLFSGLFFTLLKMVPIFRGTNYYVLPFLLGSGLLYYVSVPYFKIHICQLKSLKVDLREIFFQVLDANTGSLFFTFVSTISYLLISLVFGFILLIENIPGIGDFVKTIFSFLPTLLNLLSLLLCFFNLMIIFFLSPIGSIKKLKKIELVKQSLTHMQGKALSSVILFFLGILPLALIIGFLSFSQNPSLLSQNSDLITQTTNTLCYMIPSMFIITPFVMFFLNFSFEAYLLLQVKKI
jgi:hypothetical protein